LTPILASTLLSLLAASPPPEVELPLGCGYAFNVSQTHNIGSHLQNDTWAWDFRMPEGTPVVAAHDGLVRMARGDSKLGGCDPKLAHFANYVVVDHKDGYEAQYLHFSQVVVKPGQWVKAGELLGYSGETGWACGAHLHFKVARAVSSGWNNPSVPARIKGYGDPELESVVSGPTCTGAKVYLASHTPATSPEGAEHAVFATAAAPLKATGMGATKPAEQGAREVRPKREGTCLLPPDER
jgi:murein DD-endopeptidase MepM/ murein hydrolase activator NlpD